MDRPQLSSAGSEASLAHHSFDPSVGMTLNFAVRPGSATVMAVRPDVNGVLRVLVGAADAVVAPESLPGNNMVLKPLPSLQRFLDMSLGGGFGHHFVAVHGDVVEPLALTWEMIGATVTTVT